MIDPKALQQHFRKIYQTQELPKQDIPRVVETTPLTSIQPIHVEAENNNEDILNTNLDEVVPIKEEIVLTVNAQTLSEEININEIEEQEESSKTDDYDPYGYYSSRKL